MALRIIIPREEAEKHFSKELVNTLVDTGNPLSIIYGSIWVLTTNEPIKEAILFDLNDAVYTEGEQDGK